MIPTNRHRIVLTQGVVALKENHPEQYQDLITKVREFNQFVSDPNDDRQNDPYGEHDFGSIEIGDSKYFWKVDYYDAGWENGVNPREEVPNLLLTIMAADEY